MEDKIMDNQVLEHELKRGMFITLEGTSRDVISKIATILPSVLKYEFKDEKFVVVDPFTCTELASSILKILNTPSEGATCLLLYAALISEVNNIIESHLLEGTNVICASYLTDMSMVLSDYYETQAISNIVASVNLAIRKEGEIVIISPSDPITTTKYTSYLATAQEFFKDENAIVKYYKIDIDNSSRESLDYAIDNIVSILRIRLNEYNSLKQLAKEMFENNATSEDSNETEVPEQVESEEDIV